MSGKNSLSMVSSDNGKKNDICISVVIPVYNAQEYIRECLDSVLKKQNMALEVICINDNSTDDSPRILEEYRAAYPNVKVLHNDIKLHAGPSRNKGLEAARGEYIHFLDADDYVVENCYSKLYKAAKENDLDWMKFYAEGFGCRTGKPVNKDNYCMKRMRESLKGRLLDFYKCPNDFRHIPVVPWNAIYKRDFLIKENIRFNKLLCVNDRSFFTECCLKGRRFMVVRINAVRYRMNMPESLVGKRAQHFYCEFDNFKLNEKICEENSISEELRFYILNREMRDITYWYSVFKEQGILPEKYEIMLREFMEEKAPYFEPYGNDSNWYKFMHADENKDIHLLLMKIKRIIDKFNSNLFLFKQLVKRDFGQRYKGTMLGMGWSIISPLLTLLIMRLVFTQFFGRDTPHYTTYLFCGNIVMAYFRESTTAGMQSLSRNASIIKMINVPKYMFLLSRNVSALINFGLTLIVFFVFCILDQITFTFRIILLIYPFICLLVLNVGVGMILSGLQIFFKDTEHLYSIFLTLLTYLSAIFYRIDLFPENIQKLFLLNPVYVIINYFRTIVIDMRVPSLEIHCLCAAYAMLFLLIGILFYKKNNHQFIYYL